MELESLDAATVIDIFLLLLIGVGPKIALVPFLEATAAMPEATKRRVLRKMLITAAVVSVLLLILGGLLTRLLHFSPGALGVASGIILLIIAITMVLGPRNGDAASHPDNDRDPMQVAVFPLAVPYLLNPAGIGALVNRIADGGAATGLSPDRKPGELKAGAAGNGCNAGGLRWCGWGLGSHVDRWVPLINANLNQLARGNHIGGVRRIGRHRSGDQDVALGNAHGERLLQRWTASIGDEAILGVISDVAADRIKGSIVVNVVAGCAAFSRTAAGRKRGDVAEVGRRVEIPGKVGWRIGNVCLKPNGAALALIEHIQYTPRRRRRPRRHRIRGHYGRHGKCGVIEDAIRAVRTKRRQGDGNVPIAEACGARTTNEKIAGGSDGGNCENPDRKSTRLNSSHL